MSILIELKRQNFNVTPEQEAELLRLQTEFKAPSIKDAIFKAVRLALFLGTEVKSGHRISLKDRNGGITDVILPELEGLDTGDWTYLVERPHSWKKQLFVKGRRLTASQVYLDMQANGLTSYEAAENWDLPFKAIEEVVRYCEQNVSLLRMESDEEKIYLSDNGVRLSA